MAYVADGWRKAAAVGSLWGASEIVLGSALHNLQIPLRGYILTAIGIAIMVASHQIWPVRGLFWRTGIVCASLKLLSPSAAIFGPMIAIVAEGFLMEFGYWALGRSKLGYFLGGALAMTEPLAQKIITLLIQFGSGLEKLYENILKFLQKQLGLDFVNLWTPIFMLIGATTIIGCVAVAFGLRVGIIAARIEVSDLVPVHLQFTSQKSRHFSGAAVAIAAIALLIGIYVTTAQTLLLGLLIAAGLAAGAAITYRSQLEYLAKPGLWIGILMILLSSPFLLNKDGPSLHWSNEGFDVGVRMATRAIIVVFSVAILSIELRNRQLSMGMIQSRRFADLQQACRMAADVLPMSLAAVPPLAEWKHPILSLAKMTARLTSILDSSKPREVLVVSGESGSGKTAHILSLADECRRAGLSVAGIVAPGTWHNNQRESFDVMNLMTGERCKLCERGLKSSVNAGPFGFSEEGISLGNQALVEASGCKADVVFVDEIGPLELLGGGWSDAFRTLLFENRDSICVVAIRSNLVSEVAEKFGFLPVSLPRNADLSDLAIKRTSNEDKRQDEPADDDLRPPRTE